MTVLPYSTASCSTARLSEACFSMCMHLACAKISSDNNNRAFVMIVKMQKVVNGSSH